MKIQIRNMARRFGLPLAAALLTAGAVLVSACGSSNDGTPLPVANFLTDTPSPAAGEVTLRAGASNGTMVDLEVRVQGPVAGIMAANFDLLFQTFRCQDNLGSPGTQNTCFTDSDCLAGESCRQSGNLVARFRFATLAPSLLDCGLPGTLNPLLLPSPLDPERLIIGMTRINRQACSTQTLCGSDNDCVLTGELCGAVGRCVKPSSSCTPTTGCQIGEVCVEQACDVGLGVNAVLLTLTFDILDRGSIRVEFAAAPDGTPPTLEDLNTNPISGVSFTAGTGGTLQGL